ncbi:sodium-dependent transporter [Pseudarthrobacter sp. J75]|uniref:sodium-dependent transporter n=1 Tax=unclassified Pseudarthrobacter TaxID=2647000 RepID=UPI002E80C0DD|nr:MULTISPECIES: sodium-dependent transporter [unclassified Pseudarthrobacter]MEE2522439.1 sodium-dependent transporter [Pseudarthrobacter sp. J47]MEE2529230.1 sodium-dependent transporter [Pseudarthrobacter sp. J75]MEE2570508.1 sodium-dependent transporter [Pseudarthrobacter sp. J64]
MSSSSPRNATAPLKRETFSSRRLFILSAIGSAVGLGNIWRFPYIAYDNGGGAFLIPYLVALLTAGIPLLFLDYAVGHKFRGSAPLAYRRLHRAAEPLGWWQVLVCFVIAAYYAVIIAWSLMYTIFSFTEAWGDDAEGYFFGDFLQLAEAPGLGFSYVPSVFFPLLLIWVAVIVIMVAGIRKGISRANSVLLPLLVVMFLLLVVQSLFLPGAAQGLNAFFTPDWSALADPGVWAAAYGHIFFSLSVGYGIMVTYSSYLKRKTDLTGSGMVVAFANSGFEILAGIGVFAALGFMAQAAGAGVNDVVTQGIGLAFVAFPTIVSQAPFGGLMGVLFFGSLVFAGVTSLISVLEVIVSAVQDKLGWGRVRTSVIVSGLVAVVSLALFPTATGLYLLDTSDAFVNSFGITLGALVTVVIIAWFLRKLPLLSGHLNRISTIKMRRGWMVLVAGVVPLALIYMVANEFISKISTTYEGYPDWFVGIFGWGMAGGLVVLAVVLTFIPWSRKSKAHHDPEYDSVVEAEAKETAL